MRKLHISIGSNRKATLWQQASLSWEDFCERIQNPVRSPETMQEYIALPKTQQDELKDVGGFVGGSLKDSRRKAVNVTGRDLVTLDLDNIEVNGTGNVLSAVSDLGCSAVVYSTRKHTSRKPRLRVVIPLNKTVSADEYEPIARKIAEYIGIERCDPTTFEAVRLMYWGSCCADGEWVCKVYKGGLADGQEILKLYDDWKDFHQWPVVPGEGARQKKMAAKQTDPRAKQGIVGQFCRCYGITEAIAKFLPEIYTPTKDANRYTYCEGSTAGGLVIYDNDLFAFSHHATDPCSGIEVNAFDLVRLNKFGHLDAEKPDGTAVTQLPSMKAMQDFALTDKAVIALAIDEQRQAAADAFGPPVVDETDPNGWKLKLARDKALKVLPTIDNFNIIIECDPALKGRIRYDIFGNRIVIERPVPWDKTGHGVKRYDDTDAAGLHHYMEKAYGALNRANIDEAVLTCSWKNRYNEVAEYLQGLTWDGVPRVDTLLSVYLGAEDTEYSRAAMRKVLCAAVARAKAEESCEGVKFDTMMILTGPQGIGKSTLLSKLGQRWFSDSLTVFDGKEAMESIQGIWICEVGELTAFTKSENESIKQFLSKKDDTYRPAYGKYQQTRIRRCVFVGTSNQEEFLRDTTGNRRFWPIDVGVRNRQCTLRQLTKDIVDQIWAEACVLLDEGEDLFMSEELEALAMKAQEQHRETSRWEGQIRGFLDTDVPEGWEDMDADTRILYKNASDDPNLKKVKRQRVCAMEIWVECLGGNSKFLKQSDAREINAVIKASGEWDPRVYVSKLYGIQRGFFRKI